MTTTLLHYLHIKNPDLSIHRSGFLAKCNGDLFLRFFRSFGRGFRTFFFIILHRNSPPSAERLLLHFLLSLFTTKYTLFSLFFQVFLCLFLCEIQPIFLLLALLFSHELTHNVFYASCMAHPKAKPRTYLHRSGVKN